LREPDFRCTDCDYPLSLDAADELPPAELRRDRVRAGFLFTTSQTSIVEVVPKSRTATGSMSSVRHRRAGPVPRLPHADEDVVAFSLHREWTRIGRSLAADIRFDDPTVSRRHALIVRQPDGLRVLDDRSLNACS